MFGNRKNSRKKGGVPSENQARVNESQNVIPSASMLSRPVHDIEFQPSEICPQNFVIFDETESSSRVMFHPAIADNSSYPHFNFHEPSSLGFTENYGNNFGGGIASPQVEDSDYIDLLLSLDEEDQRGSEEDEEISTARTQGHYDGSSSPESCCNYGSKCQKVTYPSNIQRSFHGGSSSRPDNKRKEARKMVKALRGMLPGGNQMNTASVFDAAVQHLKGLEDKVQRLGLSNPSHFSGN